MRPKPRGGRGTNQYQIKDRPQAPPVLTTSTMPMPYQDREREAIDPFTPPSRLMQLATDPQSAIRLAVLRNPNVPTEAIPVLLPKPYDPDDWDWQYGLEIRHGVAQHPRTPKTLLSSMSGSYEDQRITIAVAQNPNTPFSVIQRYATNTDPHIRKAVAQNPNVPKEILVNLLADPEPSVCQAAALNPTAPAHIRAIGVLGGDSNHS